MVEIVTDAADPRIAEYRDLKDGRPPADGAGAGGGTFIAESELVVRKLLASPLPVRSVLLTAPRLRALEPVLEGRCPVYLAAQSILDGIAGFHVHRGCLALGERPRAAAVPEGARTVVALEDLVDVDNVGALVRNAACFGADAVVLSPRAADPFYRKAIRVSAGSVFAIPIVRCRRWPDDLVDLRRRLGLSLVGAVLDPGAVPLPDYARPERVALVLGSEGAGLSRSVQSVCDALVNVPMAPGADSLNVATAGAVILYHLTARGPT